MNKKIKIFPYLATLAFLLLVACSSSDMDYRPQEHYKISQVLSIFSHDNTVGTSVVTLNGFGLNTEFRLNDETVTLENFTEVLPVGANFQTSINASYYISTIFRESPEVVHTYRFYKDDSRNPYEQMFFIKDNVKVNLEYSKKDFMFGEVSAVGAKKTKDVFAGSFKELIVEPTPKGYSLVPVMPFFWDGEHIKLLSFPKNDEQYRGINSIHLSDDLKHVYIAGIMKYPMYWVDENPVTLSNKYMGEVTQIVTQGEDVYAAGYINKFQSRDVNNTACYWKNGKIVELEDQGVATSIYIDGEDIYIGGATGRTPDDFKACYWKNGVKVVLK